MKLVKTLIALGIILFTIGVVQNVNAQVAGPDISGNKIKTPPVLPIKSASQACSDQTALILQLKSENAFLKKQLQEENKVLEAKQDTVLNTLAKLIKYFRLS